MENTKQEALQSTSSVLNLRELLDFYRFKIIKDIGLGFDWQRFINFQ